MSDEANEQTEWDTQHSDGRVPWVVDYEPGHALCALCGGQALGLPSAYQRRRFELRHACCDVRRRDHPVIASLTGNILLAEVVPAIGVVAAQLRAGTLGALERPTILVVAAFDPGHPRRDIPQPVALLVEARKIEDQYASKATHPMPEHNEARVAMVRTLVRELWQLAPSNPRALRLLFSQDGQFSYALMDGDDADRIAEEGARLRQISPESVLPLPLAAPPAARGGRSSN